MFLVAVDTRNVSSIELIHLRRLNMEIIPMADRVLVKRVEKIEVSAGGIVLPQTGQQAPNEGVVVAVGPGRLVPQKDGSVLLVPVQLKVGDRVLFESHLGIEVKRNGVDHLVIQEASICAVITGVDSAITTQGFNPVVYDSGPQLPVG